jgi:hypothetical protein
MEVSLLTVILLSTLLQMVYDWRPQLYTHLQKMAWLSDEIAPSSSLPNVCCFLLSYHHVIGQKLCLHSTATYVNNQAPTKALDGETPYKYWYGSDPDLNNLRIFGCRAYVKRNIPQSKLDPDSWTGTFLGYCQRTGGYRILKPRYKQNPCDISRIFQ